MPQLNPEFFVSQLFWLFIFFSFLLIFLWRVSLPRISKVLEKRQNKIDNNLSSAKELKEHAQLIEKKINEEIYKAKEETSHQIKQSLSSFQDDISSKLSSLDKELNMKINNSEKEIIKQKDYQMKKIDEEIFHITKITVSKITKINLSDDEINNAIESNKGILN